MQKTVSFLLLIGHGSTYRCLGWKAQVTHTPAVRGILTCLGAAFPRVRASKANIVVAEYTAKPPVNLANPRLTSEGFIILDIDSLNPCCSFSL
jgi:hypothetical protein